MATQPKSKAVQEYRRQISFYLEAVMLAKGWRLVRMGAEAGGLKHTTISRAIKMQNTLGFPALLALEASSRLPIPDTLRGAAIAAQQPSNPEVPTADEIDQAAAELRGKSPEFRRALLKELQRSLSKAS